MKGLTWKQFSALLQELKENNEFGAFRNTIIARCSFDFHAFCSIFFQHYCENAFNKYHLDKFRDFVFGQRGARDADAAPRGYAKSTIEVLFKPLHDIAYESENFILILSNTYDQSVSKVQDIRSELIENKLYSAIYGDCLASGKAGKDNFIVSRGDYQCRITALGSGSEMRGIRHKNFRPTKIILDDIEHSTEVEKEMLRNKMQEWFKDVVGKLGSPKTNYSIVGTVLHERSLLKSLIENPRYKSRMYKAIISWATNKKLWDEWTEIYTNFDLDKDDRQKKALKFYHDNKKKMDEGVEVLWPDREPYYALQEEIIEYGIRSFMKEKQNSPMTDETKVFDPVSFKYYTKTAKGILITKTKILVPWNQLTSYGVIDPSTGERKPSTNRDVDFTCILSGYKDMRGRLFVDSDITKRIPPSVFVRRIFEQQAYYKYRSFGVEINLFRNLLMKNLLDERKKVEKAEKRKIECQFYQINQVENKHKRIYSVEPKVFHGQILFNSDQISTEFWNQLKDFPKGDHDDCPDALEMLWGLVNNKYKVSPFNY